MGFYRLVKNFVERENEEGSEKVQEAIKRKRVVGVHQGSDLSPLLFAIVVDIATENAKNFWYADYLALMSEMKENLKKRFLKWRNALESKGMKVNLEKTKVMVCGLEGEFIRSRINLWYMGQKGLSRIDPCAMYDYKLSILMHKMRTIDSWKVV